MHSILMDLPSFCHKGHHGWWVHYKWGWFGHALWGHLNCSGWYAETIISASTVQFTFHLIMSMYASSVILTSVMNCLLKPFQRSIQFNGNVAPQMYLCHRSQTDNNSAHQLNVSLVVDFQVDVSTLHIAPQKDLHLTAIHNNFQFGCSCILPHSPINLIFWDKWNCFLMHWHPLVHWPVFYGVTERLPFHGGNKRNIGKIILNTLVSNNQIVLINLGYRMVEPLALAKCVPMRTQWIHPFIELFVVHSWFTIFSQKQS